MNPLFWFLSEFKKRAVTFIRHYTGHDKGRVWEVTVHPSMIVLIWLGWCMLPVLLSHKAPHSSLGKLFGRVGKSVGFREFASLYVVGGFIVVAGLYWGGVFVIRKIKAKRKKW